MKHVGTAKFTIVSGAAAASVYLVMIFWTLHHLRQVAGVPPFDMQPFGYSVLEARQLLTALGEQGRHYYFAYQIPLDLIYPALLALTLISILRWSAGRAGFPKAIRAGVSLALCAASLDYLENAFVAAMLIEGPGSSEVLIRLASLATLLKSLATTAALIVVLLVCTSILWRYICSLQGGTSVLVKRQDSHIR